MAATTNLVTNPSFETNSTGWTNTGLSTMSRVITTGYYGTSSLYLADTVSGASEYVATDYMAVTAGTIYSASAHIEKGVIDETYTGALIIIWYTSGNVYISQENLVLPAGTLANWTRVTLSATAPVTAAKAQILFSDSGITAGNWTMLVDGVQFEAQPAATAYCDGDQPGCAWSGTAHASTSTRTAGAAYTTITITDDTTTLTLTDGRNYALVDQGWAPAVAPLRLSTLGGRGPYEDVVEQLTVNVLGETGVEALFNLGELNRMLDQAERWGRGEPVATVKFTYQPQGSVLTTALQCVILGRAGGSAVSTSATFNDLLMCYEIANVQLAFVRRGLWIDTNIETLAETTATATPSVHTLTFAGSPTTLSPLKLRLRFNTGVGWVLPGFLLTTSAAPGILVVDGYTFTTSAPWSTLADTTYLAAGSGILRYTPADTSYHGPSSKLITTVGRRFAIFATVRNNSTTVGFQVKVGITYPSLTVWASPVTIDTSSQKPRAVFLGYITTPNAAMALSLSVKADATAGSPTIDFDTFVLLSMDDIASNALALTLPATVIGSTYYYVDPINLYDPNALNEVPVPVTMYDTTSVLYYPISYSGDPNLVTTGTTYCLLLATGDSYWQPATSAPAALTMRVIGSRYQAYLTPR